ncbi:glycosyltransferase family 4 protein [Alphaproteobacteria bacterium]|nr:glycosyltransferase family 4 protein [Alphaproteobacteria bacterium]
MKLKLKRKYKYIFITELPVFYKVNLYEQLSRDMDIFVIFLASGTLEQRSSDFISTEIFKFDHVILNNTDLQNRNALINYFRIMRILNEVEHNKVVFCAWGFIETWLLIFMRHKTKNAFVLESTHYDSEVKGWKSFFKKIFLLKISTVFASGKHQIRLLELLNYQGEIIETFGVGLINKIPYKATLKNYSGRFIFVGRLIEKKNIELLISVFNDLPKLKLTIVGEGVLLQKISKTAGTNIEILGSIKNSNLPNLFDQHDILILPSQIEPWGLVAEEALYYGLPTIISEVCGVRSILLENKNCISFDPRNAAELKSLVSGMSIDFFRFLCSNVGSHLINKKDGKQLKAYYLSEE